MKKNIAMLLSLTLGLTAVGCALPALETRAESSKELIVLEPPTDSGETDTTGTEAVTMFRLYNPNSGEHFYTGSETEKDGLVKEGWNDEGIGWIAPVISDTPVYRLYNGNAGDHHYTMNEKERDGLIVAGWKDEGIGWYSDDEKTVPLFREYNPNAVTGTHNYTTDKAEHDGLVAAGWDDEGIGWYAIGDGKNPIPKKPDDDSLEIGDIVILGTYEQDNDLTNGPEPIEWQYIGDRDGHKYLLSKYALDGKPFNDEPINAWDTCTLRKWLNEDFYDTAFSADDKKKVVTAHNENPSSYELYVGTRYEGYGSDGCGDTDDNVFLMSWTEARDYLDGKKSDFLTYQFSDPEKHVAINYNPEALCRPTAYAIAQGVNVYKNSENSIKFPPDTEGCCMRWRLRSPGDVPFNTQVVIWSGVFGGWNVNPDEGLGKAGVRPAILID